MKKGIVVEGDPTTGGGEVLVGSGYMIDGETIAVLGDPVSCKIPLHGSGNIVEGDPNLLVNGKPVALHGHKVSCGCTLIAVKLPELNFVDKPVTTFEESMCLADYGEKFAKEARKESLKEIFNIPIPENIKSIANFVLNLLEECGPKEICTKLPINKLFTQNPKRCEFIVQNKNDKQKKIFYETSGKRGAWNYALNNPKQDSYYLINKTFEYETDPLNRVVVAQNVKPLAPVPSDPNRRNKTWQSEVGASGGRGKDSQGKNLDDGGHIFANQFQGPGEKINMVPQDRYSNQNGEWRRNEERWQTLSEPDKYGVKNDVYLKIKPVYEGNSVRPKEFLVKETIVDGYTGEVTRQELPVIPN